MGKKPEKPSLGIFGRLGLIPILIAVLGKAFFSTVAGVFVSRKHKPSSYYKWVMYSTFHTFSANVSSAQEQFIYTNTDKVYLQWCKGKKVEPQSDTLGDGTKVHWVGDKTAESVLLYFHGGGYNAPLTPQHLDYLYEGTQYLTGHSSPSAAKARSFSVLILSYDCAPYAKYPRQLAQAAMTLNFMLTSLQLKPSHILIGGDSAGGHLSLNLLEHILHPHPDRSIPEVKLPEGQKLKAALLLSPWTELSTHAESYKRNAWKDIIPTQTANRWGSLFTGGAPRDPYNAPLTAPRGWWKDLSNMLEDLYICGGRDEILIDDIDKFVEVMRAEWQGPGKLKVDMIEGECHDSILCDRIMGIKGSDIKMDAVFKNWLEEAVPVA